MTEEEKNKDPLSAETDVSNNEINVKDIETQLAEKEIALLELKDKLLRTLAEMENIRKRSAIDVKNASDYAVKNFALSMLDTKDNLERALSFLPQDVPAAFKEGIELTLDSLTKTFSSFGITEAAGVSALADSSIHQIIGEIESDSPAGTITEVLQKGYFIKDRPLREAMVMVAKEKQKNI